MTNIQQMIKHCSLCGDLPKLVETPAKLGKTNFIIIGESPAKNGWIESKNAFYNTAGKLHGTARVLQKLLKTINLTLDDIYFTECCKCIIEDRKNLPQCSSNCMPILIKQLNQLPCDTILSMGMHPTQAILNTRIKKFSDYVGKEFSVTLGEKQYTLIPIYHASPLNPKGYQENLPIFEKLQNIYKNEPNN